ncbi:RING finger protein [Lignipirellula cremea]|uniref:Uncharacterized protein n=1 Tax=Lignipirellula cremea TaxID=2528010 RepID=A0A518DSS0_9BACT|nr:RING finger protein [Lignipirellula cremea]QDU94887.1 hypothetical protein Pla8534_26950 [Lignipirellula cremea]
MECLFVFFLFLVVLAVIAAYGAVSQSKADRINSIYRNLAVRFRGHHTSPGWFRRPSVRFRYGSTHVMLSTVSPYGKRGPEYTQAMISWPDHSLQAEIFPSRMSPFQPQQISDEFACGSQQFASDYVVRANDHPAMERFLSEGVQWQINRLRRIEHSDEVHLHLYRGRLIVRKMAKLAQYNQLEDFLSMCLELYDQAMLTRVVGISFIEPTPSSDIPEPECQVCGDAICTDMVFCRRCQTPHHLECWQYFGECSVYGCGEKRCVAPNVVGPTKP